LAVIQAIMNKSKREGLLANVPSFPKVKLPKERTRWLTMDEDVRLHDLRHTLPLSFRSVLLAHLMMWLDGQKTRKIVAGTF
jgi:hypothetical protein